MGRHGAQPHARSRSVVTARRRAGVARFLALGAAGAVLASCAAGTPGAARAARHPGGTTTSTSTSTTSPGSPADATHGPDCPLTGLPARRGKIPERAALAVKVDNYPTARPQSGLTAADIVFEEPVEGALTRYVAVFQCHGTSTVGPVRSARNIDIGILGEFGDPILVHMGGIAPVIANIDASPLFDFELWDYTSIIQSPPDRVPPYDTYTSPTKVWRLVPTHDAAPSPVFSYSTTVPAGTPVSSVSIPFSSASPVVWRYDAKTHKFLRYYDATPDKLSNGVQNSAANVVVQFVDITYGPWLENTEGGLEVQANLYTDASGTALVFRNGVEVAGHWSRDALTQPTQFTTATGTPIALQPGNTWVELVPTSVTVTTTPPAG